MIEWWTWVALLDSFVEGAKRLFESNFITALFGSLAGALGGAWAAQRIAERSKVRQDLLTEIRNVNAAATFAYGIANSYLALKSQHVKRLHDDFNRQKAQFNEFGAKRRAGLVDKRQPFNFKADFETLSPIKTPIAPLQALVFEKISVIGRPLSLVGVLSQSISALDEMMEARNKIIASTKERRPSHEELKRDELSLNRFWIPESAGF